MPRRSRTHILFHLIFFSSWTVAAAPPVPALDPALAARIDALFADWDRADSPGCTLGVARDGAMLYQRGYGMASLEYSVRNAPETVFPVGSNSKQFMAMLIALLAEEGKLSLDDDIRTYLPEMPVYERPITVRMLIHHTSGLRDYQTLRFLAGFPAHYVELEPVLGLLVRQRGLDFPPGERFGYSNTNYVLLRVIAERVSGKALRELGAERIFGPLGMAHSQWSEDFQRVIPGRATPHEGNRERGFRTANVGPLAGSGGVWTTVGDLLRWDENFYSNRLGKGDQELITRVLNPEGGRDGAPAGYGFGIFLGEHRGRPIAWHAGRGPGYVADLVRFPREHLAVFCLCNGTIDSRHLSRAVADLVLGVEPAGGGAVAGGGQAPARPPAVPLAAEDVAALAGEYVNGDTGTVWSLAPAGEALALEVAGTRIALAATGPGELWTASPDLGWRITVERGPEGRGQTVHLFEEGAETARYERLPPPPTAAALAAYAGRYANDELDAVYHLTSEGDRLRLGARFQPNGLLRAVGQDRFLLVTEWFTFTFRFRRDAAGRPDGFLLDTGSGTGFRFARVP